MEHEQFTEMVGANTRAILAIHEALARMAALLQKVDVEKAELEKRIAVLEKRPIYGGPSQ